MKMPKFYLVIWAKDTNSVFFRDFMESMVAQVYDNWELYLLDDNPVSELPRILTEFFPEDARVHYRQLKNHRGQAYALNIGLHFVSKSVSIDDIDSSYIVIPRQHDRLSPNTLFNMAQSIMQGEQIPQAEMEEQAGQAQRQVDVIYTDHDEIVGVELMHPHYKPDFNKELLLHRNYIGGFLTFSCRLFDTVGAFREKLQYAFIYEYILRCVENNTNIVHISSLLYHERQMVVEDKKQASKQKTASYKEHIAVCQSYLNRNDTYAVVEADPKEQYWKIQYRIPAVGADSYQHNKKNYMVLHDSNTKVYTRQAMEKMYGLIRQKDVAVVGIRYLKGGLTIDNCGYIYDKDGSIYPALYDTKIYKDTYENRGVIPQDVSGVDFDFCVIDRRIYKKLHGFDNRLTGRELILDYCLRARAAGYRVVIQPAVIGRKRSRIIESSKESNEYFCDKWKDVLTMGDPYYNPNLYIGLENYTYLDS